MHRKQNKITFEKANQKHFFFTAKLMNNHEYVFQFILHAFVSFIYVRYMLGSTYDLPHACNNKLSHSLNKHWLHTLAHIQQSIIPLTQKQIHKFVTIKMCLKKNPLTKDHNSFVSFFSSSALFSFSSLPEWSFRGFEKCYDLLLFYTPKCVRVRVSMRPIVFKKKKQKNKFSCCFYYLSENFPFRNFRNNFRWWCFYHFRLQKNRTLRLNTPDCGLKWKIGLQTIFSQQHEKYVSLFHHATLVRIRVRELHFKFAKLGTIFAAFRFSIYTDAAASTTATTTKERRIK